MSARILELASELAKPFEGLHDLRHDGLVYPYYDPVKLRTIGYGHLLSRVPGGDLDEFPPITVEEAERLLVQDMQSALASVSRLITVPLTDEQCAALVDFAFNCGSGNLQASTLRKVVNRGEFEDAPKQFMRWVYARGVKLSGLVRRRRAEAEMWAA